MSDTIFALSSGPPPAAIAVIRVSGPAAFMTVEQMARTLPSPRTTRLRALRDRAGQLLDRALVLTFPGPATATGEDLVEIHAHGGRAVIAGIENALVAAGLRRAEPGEFTRRALMAGRIDLAEAQGLADLLEAETEAERRVAVDAAEGRVSRAFRGWLDRLTQLSAQVEALLDFGDEEDVGTDDVLAIVEADRATLAAELRDVLASPPVERLRDGVRVVIGGPPNAGKSTLMNMMVQRDAAIVSPIAGTTRDRVEANVRRSGRAWLLVDTAGLTATVDPVEAIGVERAHHAIEAADLLIWMGDAPPPRADAVWIHARADLPDRQGCPAGPDLAVAQSRLETIDRLWDVLEQRAAAMMPVDRMLLHRHQRGACETALLRLEEDSFHDPVLVAEQLRSAHRTLGSVIGIDATEAMLDALFGRFCIGK